MGRPKHPGALTPAEFRVLEEVRLGRTNAEIAVRLGLSVNTVKYHVANMLAKLELADRAALSTWKPTPEQGARAQWLAGPLVGWTLAAAVSAAAIVVFIAVAAQRTSPSGTDPLLAAESTPVSAVSSVEPSPTPIPAGPPVGQIAFVAASPGSEASHLFVVPAAGGAETRLTHDEAARFSPVWSPTDDAIAYLEVPLDMLDVIADPFESGRTDYEGQP